MPNKRLNEVVRARQRFAINAQRPTEMFPRPYSCSPPRQLYVTHRLERQQQLQQPPSKMFSVSSQVKYVAATNAQHSTINYQLILNRIRFGTIGLT
jgi:hypothetical protein